MTTIPRTQAGIIPLCERPAWEALQQPYAKIQNVFDIYEVLLAKSIQGESGMP